MKQLSQTELIELFTMLEEIKQTMKDYKHVSKYLPTELVNQLIDIQNTMKKALLFSLAFYSIIALITLINWNLI